ncbi:MAG: UDP-N-acetylglucosamine--N-acetylmuramyl-(pentapeptide) pyrophosphoryl-undecaprenol N-acetylglucosamine transferase [Candidatus Aegiribacteria sp.]|nr:UDP-N-acetylglucosamine--N-acetylmuramyl-(pentapeptide) pyrophosphoryl-undecaprenol N-acetylglucosamine transferase [Candidatus Aegiribacteria sp.]
MKIAIAGGGTGGHISPAIAVAEIIFKEFPEVTVDFIATPRPVDRRMYRQFESMVHTLDPPRIDRGFSEKLLFPIRAIRSFIRIRRLLRELDSSALLSTGGYSSFFPVVAARSLGIPSVIHESNSIPGRANRLAATFANKILIGFESASSYFKKKPVVLTGNPVRPTLERIEKREARNQLGIPPESTVILLLGGSQGAKAINDIAVKVPEGVYSLLQCGSRDKDRVIRESRGNNRITVVDFTDNPALLYSAADIAVARSGAMTTAELSWFRIPSIYIPYPYAADNHQKWNAASIAEKGGAIEIDQDGLEPDDVWKMITGLLGNPSSMDKMKIALAEMMPVNPAAVIARNILALSEES